MSVYESVEVSLILYGEDECDVGNGLEFFGGVFVGFFFCFPF